MDIKRGIAVVLLLGAASCSSDEPRATPEPAATSPSETSPAYIESDECRADATRALDVLDQAINAADADEMRARVNVAEAATDDLGACTSAVSEPAQLAVASLSAALTAASFDTAIGAPPDVSDAYERATEARRALDATE